MNNTASLMASPRIPDSLHFTTITYEILWYKSLFDNSTLVQFPRFGEHPQLLFD
jgi:hypothetical protein